MGTNSSVLITAGTGTPVDAYLLAGGDYQQIIQIAKGTAKSNNTWTVSQTASTSQIAADVTRLGMIMVNNSSGRVYLRFDSTAPTATVYDTFVEAGERYVVEDFAIQLAISVLGQFAGGTLNSTLFTAA